MVFQSFKFLVFFPIVVAVYFAIPFRYRRVFLFIVSYYFYMCFKPEYVVILLASTLLDYYLGLQIGKCQDQRKRKKLLVLGIIHNIGLLACLKYLDFFKLRIVLYMLTYLQSKYITVYIYHSEILCK